MSHAFIKILSLAIPYNDPNISGEVSVQLSVEYTVRLLELMAQHEAADTAWVSLGSVVTTDSLPDPSPSWGNAARSFQAM
jgi:hypothetical protein